MANRVDFSTETVGKMLKAAAKAAHKNINAHTPMNRPKMVRSVWFNRGYAAGVAAATAEAEKKFRVGDKELVAPDGEPIVVQLTDSMESVEPEIDVVDVVDTTADEGAIIDEDDQKRLLDILAAFGKANGLDPIKA
jgi:hypothetical protein